MLRWESGRVIAHRKGWPGVASLQVEVVGAGGAPETLRALAYTELVGTPEVGEVVDLNTNALRRGLGTGGDAIVVSRRAASPAPEPVAGHMMKLRYTPMQTMVDALDDPASDHYATLAHARDISGMPVVVADLHSSLAPIVAGIRADAPSARIVYVMGDGAALPAAYSRSLATLREHGLVGASISAGQSFGGDLEAVTVHSALLGARRVLGADVAIVIQGPGNLGTGTGWGFSGVQAGDALNAAGVLGGVPIGALRVSEADERPRHRGLSHHSATAYGRMTLVPAVFPVHASGRDGNWLFHAQVTAQAEQHIIAPGAGRGLAHELVEVRADGLMDALRALPLRLSTMGRGLDEDAASFLYGALAGRAAAARIVRSATGARRG